MNLESLRHAAQALAEELGLDTDDPAVLRRIEEALEKRFRLGRQFEAEASACAGAK